MFDSGSVQMRMAGKLRRCLLGGDMKGTAEEIFLCWY